MSEVEILIERLASFDSLAGLPQSELAWIAQHGALRQFEPAEVVVAHEADATDGLFILLKGRIVMHLSRGGERRLAAEWVPGDLVGLLPYSRMQTPPGDLVAEQSSEAVLIHRDQFGDLARECHEATTRMVHAMLDRARTFNAADLHDEKLASLGRMAAGLAHELNNPASAVASGARSLFDQLGEAEAASRALGAAGLDAEQLATIDRLKVACSTRAASLRSPLERSDFEEEVSDWLDDHEASIDHVEALAETDLTIDLLDELARAIDGEALDAALRWTAAVSSSRTLAIEVEQAALRISDLVGAVQGFANMDRGLAAEPMEISRGLRTSLLVLKSKARDKSAGLSLEIEEDLPKVNGFAGELNQVWVNLISNALDAVEEGGSVRVEAVSAVGAVVVSVVDDGTGMSEETREHIFEPFFTTKKVGDGMGLGLDIVLRLVQRNNGEIEVESRPGRTEFRVKLTDVVGS
jgi:signal transduction histidine kinase